MQVDKLIYESLKEVFADLHHINIYCVIVIDHILHVILLSDAPYVCKLGGGRDFLPKLVPHTFIKTPPFYQVKCNTLSP